MTIMAPVMDAAARAALSAGASNGPIHALVCRVLGEQTSGKGTLVDIGCGTGKLRDSVAALTREYIGCDVVRYGSLPADIPFVEADLNHAPYPIADASADVVTCVETIEHLENPRLVVRELVRIARPGGLVIVTTPNVLSLLSKLTLLLKNQFQAFGDREYPAHITAVGESDLVRIARECGLDGISIRFTDDGRIPGTAMHWPAAAGLRGRSFSDNVLVFGRKPGRS
jgi:2-polyprenyl-3-methyl-5-hydroxy-6-metoxy-1,4-benzoquinol methylase